MSNNTKSLLYTKLLLVFFYLAGVIAHHFPQYDALSIRLIPYFLLGTCFLLLFYHRPWSLDFILLILIIFSLGILVEIAGVHTGLVFGNYAYGNTLGIKILGTPLIIGVNWIILTYSLYFWIKRIRNNYLMAFTGAIILCITDFFIEHYAILKNMWQWKTGVIPVHNYIGWFVVSFIMFLIYPRFIPSGRNALAPFVYVLLLVFFILLYI